MEAGKKRLAGDTTRKATSSEVTGLKREARDLKEVSAEQTLELRLIKKVCSGMGATSNEICRIREARDYAAGRGLTSACQTYVGEVGRLAPNLLSLV